jgi:prevent-host-death family protein
MDEIAISKFKAQCLAILEQVRKTGKPIRVTRFGHPVADVVPSGGSERVPRLGTGRGSGVILGDIVGPVSDESDWEALRDNVEDDTKLK